MFAFLAVVGLCVVGCSKKADVTDDVLNAAIKESNDYGMHADVFLRAARTLVGEGRCSVKDLEYNGGFSRKTGASSIYFIVCGSTIADRWYVDASDGRVYQQ